MMVLLDTTVPMADPYLRSTAWKVLAHASRNGVRVCVPEVVRREAVAGYMRRIDEANVGLDRWYEKHAGALNLKDLADGLRAQMTERAAGYELELDRALTAAGVEILPVPAVGHEVLVDRATRRVPPCNNNGDGYRDTLNWFTLRELAASAEDQVIWVSNNTRDFTADGQNLHPVLASELEELETAARVVFVADLNEAALLAAAEFTDSEGGLATIQKRLVAGELGAYVAAHLLSDPLEIDADPEALALPIGATSPVFGSIEPLDAEVEVMAALDAQSAAVQVTLRCSASILFGHRGPHDLGDGFLLLSEADESDLSYWETSKPIEVVALVSVDQLDRPTGGDLTAVRAPSEDPGHADWASLARKRVNDWLLTRGGLQDTSAVFRRIQAQADTSELIRKWQEQNTTAAIFDRIRKQTDTSALFKKWQEQNTTAAIFERIRKQSNVSEILNKLAAQAEAASMLNRLNEAADPEAAPRVPADQAESAQTTESMEDPEEDTRRNAPEDDEGAPGDTN